MSEYRVGDVARIASVSVRTLLLAAIENELEARGMGISLSPEQQLEVFGTDRLAEWTDEAKQRWGGTESWKESQRRAARYTKEDWIEIKREADQSLRAFAAAMRAGDPAAGQAAMDLAEAHRRHISRWFYECASERHRALAELCVSDRRFERTYEEVEPGLGRYVHDAIIANAERAGA